MTTWQRLGLFFRKLGFDKGDERSVLIAAYAVRIAWIYITVALMIWMLYDVIRFHSLGYPAVFFFTSQAVFWLAMLYYQRKMGS